MFTLSQDLAEQIEAYAQNENLAPEEVIREAFTLLKQQKPELPEQDEYVMPPMDEKSIMRRIYARARVYWGKAGNIERAALTDEELDEQFWVIDHEGVPRLKEDQSIITLPPDPWLELAEKAKREGWTSGRDDISENFDDVLGEIVAEKLSRMKDES